MRTLNLALAFFLELAMLAAWAWLGLALPFAAPLPALAAVLLPLLVIAVWGLFAAPKARFPLPTAGTVAVRGALLGGGAAALLATGQTVLGAADAGLIALNLAAGAGRQFSPPASGAALRARLRALVDDYARRFPDETEVVRRFREFLGSGEVLQGKINPRRHVTASTWIVNPARTRVLLTHHAKLGLWVQLGGHTDEGEEWAAAALREAKEESGLAPLKLVSPALFDLDVHEIPAREATAESAATPAHDHYDLRFLVEADDRAPLIVSEESHALAWVAWGDLPRYTNEASQLRMARKVVREPAPSRPSTSRP